MTSLKTTKEVLKRTGLGCGAVFLLFMILGIILSIVDPDHDESYNVTNSISVAPPHDVPQTAVDSPKASKPPEKLNRAEAVEKPNESSFRIGGIVMVNNMTLVGEDWDSHGRALRAMNAKDDEGLTRLILAGKIFFITGGPVQARLMRGGFMGSEVRILTGEFATRSGCIVNESMKAVSNSTVQTKQAFQSIEVRREQFGDKWPLTVESGTVICLGNRAIILRAPDGSEYALNGPAIQMGYQRISSGHPIWRNSGKYGDLQTKMDIGVLTAIGLKLCQ